MTKENWFDSFNRHFEVIPANTDELIKQVKALRFQIYCVEHPFEDKTTFKDGLEQDQYDQRAVHSLVRHLKSKPDEAAVATVRLVLSDNQNPQNGFPIEDHCSISPEDRSSISLKFERKQIAEISRFAVSKQFRRRVGESETIHGIAEHKVPVIEKDDRRLVPHITLGLFQAIVQMSAENNIKLWYAVMETQLLRLLKRFGIRFTQIGEPVNYHGLRVPCIGPVDEVMSGIKRDCPAVWEFITQKGRLWPY
ncbi:MULTISPECIES: PEP-CTERM/exosortase system-associated acyltransferase [Methylocaldum]|jgi:N-acyl amino acid synthase of PEP-CTERM/exosortase system|uniref:PEP-CTERM/exosortase system-associated acyltransferase n=1 Tax=unclassified Methylocaldum TaxID=2622260 RepID=UPI00098B1ACA|nr:MULTISPECIES: PEP-CTERM/exosortase system-associated acyltransferase [unclassified Methylocaldum]MBP1151179.1 N-acyl amino acid synthase of PEP-CTERM/exosortase system [Methylocaldum sp. RMAD-M]MDV3241705.1 PEP-CTERM/exosortase system-associated acyltransferase [Methylocaldum sp.]MVF21851.1 PEP-CTERM/exosortase system-associated acyltransferase [Methylocaldum sp. BRCS4]